MAEDDSGDNDDDIDDTDDDENDTDDNDAQRKAPSKPRHTLEMISRRHSSPEGLFLWVWAGSRRLIGRHLVTNNK